LDETVIEECTVENAQSLYKMAVLHKMKNASDQLLDFIAK
jgi:hypothetical protein